MCSQESWEPPLQKGTRVPLTVAEMLLLNHDSFLFVYLKQDESLLSGYHGSFKARRNFT